MAVGRGARDLSAFFNPRSVAVVGASVDRAKWGGDIAWRLSRDEGRTVFYVNANGDQLYGRAVYRSLRDLPQAPELVILAMPAAHFAKVVDDALRAGAKAIISVSAGLGERSKEGRAVQEAAVARIRAAGAALVGPNCMGLADTASGLHAVGLLDVPAGNIGFISQSGAMGEEFVMRCLAYGCGFSRYVSLGNQADVTIAEVFASFAEHEPTKAVAVYAEDFADGRAFAYAAQSVTASGRPVVLLAPGVSEAGARAAASHTGALAADSAVLDAVCRDAGVVRVSSPQDLFGSIVALTACPRPAGRRVVVLSEAGGHGALAADLLWVAGLDVPGLSEATMAAVRETLPLGAGSNPIDFALASTDAGAYGKVMPLLLDSAEVDMVLAVGQLGLRHTRFSEQTERLDAELAGARAVARSAHGYGKPVVVSTVYTESEPAAALRRGGVPVFREIDSAVSALKVLVEFALSQPSGVPELPDPAQEPLSRLDYFALRDSLGQAGVPFVEARAVRTADEAVEVASQLGYPLALKAVGLLHKSDRGGVVLDVADAAALRFHVGRLVKSLRPEVFSLEHMAPLRQGVELIVGCRRDPRFGPLLLVGLGGIFTEVMGDVAMALAPIEEAQAERLLRSLRGASVLMGVRGRPPLHIAAAARVAAAVSRYFARHPELSDLEVNPLLVTPEGAIGLDARAIAVDTR
jgi:acetate---CoA ligase (ADP-forming)